MDSLKVKAIRLRTSGYSYNMITDKIGVSKSTLSNWLAKIPFSPNKQLIKRIGFAKLKSANFKHHQKLREINEMNELAKQELGRMNQRDLWLLGLGLYLGEGGKAYEQVRISNSDPKIIKMSIVWLKEICGLSSKNINPVIHIYPDSDREKSLRYWSLVTGIHRSQFGKIQIDKRINKLVHKKNSLPYGTLHVRIRANGNKNFGRRLHRKIMGWTKASFDQIDAGII